MEPKENMKKGFINMILFVQKVSEQSVPSFPAYLKSIFHSIGQLEKPQLV